jgi:hypothetical protein
LNIVASYEPKSRCSITNIVTFIGGRYHLSIATTRQGKRNGFVCV